MKAIRRRWPLGLIALGALLEPLGHQVAYSLRYGLIPAIQIQSQGSHAYFPRLAWTASLTIAVGLALAMLAAGTVRLALGPQRVRSAGSARIFLQLAATQSILFLVQESLEAAFRHTNPDFLVIAILALLAQLPVAALAAWTVALLSGYVALAPHAVRVILALRLGPPAEPVVLRLQPVPALRPAVRALRWSRRRGPPRSL
jgi:hypothetical protein